MPSSTCNWAQFHVKWNVYRRGAQEHIHSLKSFCTYENFYAYVILHCKYSIFPGSLVNNILMGHWVFTELWDSIIVVFCFFSEYSFEYSMLFLKLHSKHRLLGVISENLYKLSFQISPIMCQMFLCLYNFPRNKLFLMLQILRHWWLSISD